MSVTSLIGEVRSPIVSSGSPTVRPGVERSARKVLSPNAPGLPVRTYSRKRSATGALVMNSLPPLST